MEWLARLSAHPWFWYVYVFAALEILGLICAMTAIMRARTSQGATAWAISLLTIPYLAVPLFLIFGSRNFQGYVSRRKTSDAKLNREWKEFRDYFEKARCRRKGESQKLDVFESLAEVPFTCARSLTLLQDGEQFFPALKEALQSAKESICFQFYVFKDDEIGLEIAEVLKAKARSGVKVRILYDSLGSQSAHRRFFRDLGAAGCEVAPFISTRFRLPTFRFQINFRNHRKLVIVDNDIAFVGGLNVGDEYLSRDKKIGRWRDTHLKIVGSPAIQGLQCFVADWYWSTSKVIDFKAQQALEKIGGNSPTLILATGPVGLRENGSLGMLNAIHGAQTRLWISTPYFVPDEQIIAALQLAALRGVDVRVLVAKKTDQKIARLASFTYFDELLPSGIKIYEFKAGFLHQKVLLVDDDLAYVGSTNFDNRSFRLNFEIGAWVQAKEFAGEVETMLNRDFSNSALMDIKTIERMTLGRQLACATARLLAPVL
jgi:cardiolipin synthase